MCRAYNEASTPELKLAVVTLVKDNIKQRCERYCANAGEKEFEVFGYGFMNLLREHAKNVALKNPNDKGFAIKIGKGLLFAFSYNEEQEVYQARLDIPGKMAVVWAIE